MTNDDKYKQAQKALKDLAHSHHIFHRIYSRTIKTLEELFPQTFINTQLKEKIDERNPSSNTK